MKRTSDKHLRTAVLYARVSSKEQEKEGYSIPSQEKLLRGYALQAGFTVLKEFTDVETAKRAGRAGFTAMLAFLKKNPSCRTVLVEKTDRLYRNLRDYVTIDELDIEVHLVKENAVLSRDSKSSEKFMHGIKVLMAKNYIDNLSEETRKGMLEKAEQGSWPTRAPLGYNNVVGKDGRKAIEPDPQRAPVITKMCEWYSTGNHSLDKIVEMAGEAGLKVRKGDGTITKAGAHRILRDRVYTGEFEWSGKRYKGNYAPLVTHDLWDRVQAVMDGRYERKNRVFKHDFAFSGLINCGHCGCALVGEIKKGKYIYYHCTGHKGKCPEKYTPEKVLEERFTEVIARLKFDAEVLGLVTEALRQSHTDQKRHHDEAVARLQAEDTRLQNRLDQMYTDKLDGRIDAAFFDRKKAEWRTEQDRIQRTLQEHVTANRSYLDEGVNLLELADRAADLFRSQPAKEKRRLLDFVLSNSTWKNGQLTPKLRQPFDLLADMNAAVAKKKAEGVSASGLRLTWLPE